MTYSGDEEIHMGIWYTLLLVLHILICLFLVLLVTVQNDKGGGLAGAFGGMGGGGAFTGSSAVTILTKITQWTALIGFVVLLSLNALSSRNQRATLGDSELKGASSGLSGAIPATGTVGPTQNNVVPGAAPVETPAAPVGGAAQ
jgi:preprotein translocase subunit SecG